MRSAAELYEKQEILQRRYADSIQVSQDILEEMAELQEELEQVLQETVNEARALVQKLEEGREAKNGV